jgi:hypothetical protein
MTPGAMAPVVRLLCLIEWFYFLRQCNREIPQDRATP